MLIIGITGTIGAGKGTIVDLLVKDYQFLHFSARAFLIEEIKKQGLEVNRDSMTMVANTLRLEHSPSYIVDQLLERARHSRRNCVVESIRTPAEIEVLKKNGTCYLFAVDALPEIRYKRIKQRGSETDKVSFDTFIANEQREMTSDDPNKQNLKACIAQADFVLNNNQSISILQEEVKGILKKIGL